MFQFPAFASFTLFDSGEDTLFQKTWKPQRQSPAALIFQAFKVGCPIRKSPDQSSFAAPRRLSQRITSFIACACQGIHQLPLRHLIVLIANAHPSMFPRIEDPRKETWTIKKTEANPKPSRDGTGTKRPASRDRFGGCGQAHPSYARA